MIKKINWSMIQKEKRAKEIRDKIKLVACWSSLVCLAIILLPIIWLCLVLLLSI